ncbi:hypothetical protein ACFQ44_00490 [Levilactobacillus lanxiensis]|uniref:Uncharacterized protein n=1 Tax=Levilactobacillus lanxiensis TaxID=2799568 RepID=A0ABW4D2E9_9LACO|nr:hypothetical protein [Levilactobacillus lanxiensis]
MRQFNVQTAGADFVPRLPWSTDPSASLVALLGPEPRDLLIQDTATDELTIVPQVSLEDLIEKLGHSVYGRLGNQLLAALPVTTPAWQPTVANYLLLDLAQVNHATVLATMGALVGLVVVQQSGGPATPARLAGVASQAQCWLQEIGVTAHQLLLPAGVTILRKLLTQLLTQNRQCDGYVPADCDTHAGQLVQEAVALAHGQLETLQLPDSWRLLRVAVQERQLKNS